MLHIGGGAWTAGTSDTHQYLGIDMGYRQVVTAVATQGRRGSKEFILEYYLEFSSDNKTWNVYSNAYGTPMVCVTYNEIRFCRMSNSFLVHILLCGLCG